MRKLPESVSKLIDDCAYELSKNYLDSISVGYYLQLSSDNCQIKSPIEQLMYVALTSVRDLNDGVIEKEIVITPQYKVGQYRVDFFISSKDRSILIECDSQKFHERDEKQRRYEKERDRFFIKQGYKVFHYTGSEIVKNPLKIAREAICYVSGFGEESILTSSYIGEPNG